MRVAVVGCGTAGPAAALLLARDGHQVEIVERVADPRPVGAGILVQPVGQQVLASLGLADSDLVPLAWGRDRLLEPAARIPWLRRQFVTTLMGIRTSPWSVWTPLSAELPHHGTKLAPDPSLGLDAGRPS